jgi:predicted  nucleic acid-binding Zn-ribbon protein
MILAYLLLLTGLTISAVAIYYSVVGLTAIFSAAAIPIIIMGSALEVGKLVCASWLKANWERAPRFMKYYMVIAVVVLMLITSMGIFGFLSKAHNDQTLVSGDVGSKIAIYDEKIKTAKDNIETDRKQLKQMDEAVDQIMGRSTDEKGADKANAVRKSQQRDRSALAKDIEANQKLIATLNDEAAPIRAEVRKVEAEVGPIKYIAAFIYDRTPDESMLERAVTWIIILIVIVFDPLAVIMLLAAQMTFGWAREQKETEEELIPLVEETTEIDSLTTESDQNIVEEATVTDHPLYQFGDEVHTDDIPSETPLTALGGDITATESQEQNEESELDKWNKMIAEAEAEAEAMSQHSTVEERVATGETYINNEGKEVALEVDLPTTEESKKKTYMTKDSTGAIQVISLNK